MVKKWYVIVPVIAGGEDAKDPANTAAESWTDVPKARESPVTSTCPPSTWTWVAVVVSDLCIAKGSQSLTDPT